MHAHTRWIGGISLQASNAPPRSADHRHDQYRNTHRNWYHQTRWRCGHRPHSRAFLPRYNRRPPRFLPESSENDEISGGRGSAFTAVGHALCDGRSIPGVIYVASKKEAAAPAGFIALPAGRLYPFACSNPCACIICSAKMSSGHRGGRDAARLALPGVLRDLRATLTAVDQRHRALPPSMPDSGGRASFPPSIRQHHEHEQAGNAYEPGDVYR
jgi:hypothetical protein